MVQCVQTLQTRWLHTLPFSLFVCVVQLLSSTVKFPSPVPCAEGKGKNRKVKSHHHYHRHPTKRVLKIHTYYQKSNGSGTEHGEHFVLVTCWLFCFSYYGLNGKRKKHKGHTDTLADATTRSSVSRSIRTTEALYYRNSVCIHMFVCLCVCVFREGRRFWNAFNSLQ